jgi:hypothetical protein
MIVHKRALALVGLSLLLAGAAAGCSSSSSSQGPACNPCDTGGPPAPTGHDTNPDGIAYPMVAGGYGHSPRNGATAGSVIQNFKFNGYVSGDKSQGIQTIALADFYDPHNKRYKLLFLTAGALWCGPCNDETSQLVANKPMLQQEGVVVLQAITEGNTPGKASTQGDLDEWTHEHSVNYDDVLDPGVQNLGGFFNQSAIPWSAQIDVRTMEILSAGSGLDPNGVMSEIQPQVDWVNGNPPSYQVPK